MNKIYIFIAKWLRVIAEWLHPTEFEGPLYQEAKKLVIMVDNLDVSGEYKRHQVYAILIDKFPDEPKRNLALAIERVVQTI